VAKAELDGIPTVTIVAKRLTRAEKHAMDAQEEWQAARERKAEADAAAML
jgi:hypothetical protein